MLKETLWLTAIQSGILFLALWGIFRLVPSIPANAKVWMWRLAFLKPLLSLLPFAVISLPVLPGAAPVANSKAMPSDFYYIEESTRLTSNPTPVEDAEITETPINAPAATPDPLIAMWLMGAFAICGYAAWGTVRNMRLVRCSTEVNDPDLQEALDELCRRANLRRRPRLLASSDATTAMLVGGKGYSIVLPESSLTQGSLSDQRLMIAHEVAHIARRDLWWFGLASLVQSLFFFNPMVWIAARCSRLDHESATDQDASRLAGGPIQTYAHMLLRATVIARPRFAPGALPMAESYRTIHRRLEAMKHFNSKPTFWRRTATAALALLTMSMLPAYNLVAAALPFEDLPQKEKPKVENDKKIVTKSEDVIIVERSKDGKTWKLVKPKKGQKVSRDVVIREVKNGNTVELAHPKPDQKTAGNIVIWQVKPGKDGKKTRVIEIRTNDGKKVKTIRDNIVVIDGKIVESKDLQRIKVDKVKAEKGKTIPKTEIVTTNTVTETKASTLGTVAADVVVNQRAEPKAQDVVVIRGDAKSYVIDQPSSYIVREDPIVQNVAVGRTLTRPANGQVARAGVPGQSLATIVRDGVQVGDAWEISGKNVVVTVKDGVYTVKADGEVVIRPVRSRTGAQTFRTGVVSTSPSDLVDAVRKYRSVAGSTRSISGNLQSDQKDVRTIYGSLKGQTYKPLTTRGVYGTPRLKSIGSLTIGNSKLEKPKEEKKKVDDWSTDPFKGKGS